MGVRHTSGAISSWSLTRSLNTSRGKSRIHQGTSYSRPPGPWPGRWTQQGTSHGRSPNTSRGKSQTHQGIALNTSKGYRKHPLPRTHQRAAPNTSRSYILYSAPNTSRSSPKHIKALTRRMSHDATIINNMRAWDWHFKKSTKPSMYPDVGGVDSWTHLSWE